MFLLLMHSCVSTRQQLVALIQSVAPEMYVIEAENLQEVSEILPLTRLHAAIIEYLAPTDRYAEVLRTIASADPKPPTLLIRPHSSLQFLLNANATVLTDVLWAVAEQRTSAMSSDLTEVPARLQERQVSA